MADEDFPRFSVSNCEEINILKEKASSSNTKRSTKTWINLWKTWAQNKGVEPQQKEIFQYSPEDLDKYLQRFYAEIRTKEGENYEPGTLKVIATSIDRYLRENGYQKSILRDQEFHQSKQVLEGKARSLREDGRGKRPNKTRSLTNEEEEALWNEEKLGNSSPQVLVQTVWWLLTQYFGLRGRQEHHMMQVEDFKFGVSDDGTEFVQFAESYTKTRQSGLTEKSRSFLPKMFATGSSRCPVKLFKEFLYHRPAQLKNTGKLYLAINHSKAQVSSGIWYKNQPMGINKINSMMQEIIGGSSLDNDEVKKALKNHSARKTLVKKLKKQGLERSSIAKVTGHRNLQSIDAYESGDEQEQESLSRAISARNNLPKAPEKPPMNPVAVLPNAVQQFQSFWPQMPQGSVFQSCNFNFKTYCEPESSTKQPESPKKRKRIRVIESDSD